MAIFEVIQKLDICIIGLNKAVELLQLEYEKKYQLELKITELLNQLKNERKKIENGDYEY